MLLLTVPQSANVKDLGVSPAQLKGPLDAKGGSLHKRTGQANDFEPKDGNEN